MKLKILDFTNKLPGPLSTNILYNDFGFKITKIEFENYLDPFNTSKDKTLSNWYQNFNKDKKILKLKIEDNNKLRKEIKNHLILLIPNSKKIKNLINLPMLLKEKKHLVFVLKASNDKNKARMHDANLLNDYNYFKLQEKIENKKSFPIIPIAGIMYAQKIVQTILFSLLKNKKGMIEIIFDESLNISIGSILEGMNQNKSNQFLHTGKYLSYHIYQTAYKDKLLVTAIEKENWIKFCEFLKLEDTYYLKATSSRPKDFKLIQEKILQLNKNKLINLCTQIDCIDLI